MTGSMQKKDIHAQMKMKNVADELIELRRFALENDFEYLSSIIEPVVIEILRKLVEIDRKYNAGSIGQLEGGSNVNLSPRELECLQWCSQGKTYGETAAILNICERTVNTHVTSAREKLNATTNAHCVVKAVRQRLI